MTTNTMQQTHTTGNQFLITWGLVTGLLGIATTLPSAHSIFFFALILFVGLATSLGQWALLREHMPAAWRWVLASTFGWILAFILTGGAIYGVGAFALMMTGEVSLSLPVVKAFEVFVYTAAFGITAATQAIVLRRHGFNAGRWILWNIIGGTLLGAAMQLVCTVGGGQFFSTSFFLADGGDNPQNLCINIGLTLPRLQTSEPFFYWLPLSYAAHVVGWLVYGFSAAFGMKSALKQPA